MTKSQEMMARFAQPGDKAVMERTRWSHHRVLSSRSWPRSLTVVTTAASVTRWPRAWHWPKPGQHVVGAYGEFRRLMGCINTRGLDRDGPGASGFRDSTCHGRPRRRDAFQLLPRLENLHGPKSLVVNPHGIVPACLVPPRCSAGAPRVTDGSRLAIPRR